MGDSARRSYDDRAMAHLPRTALAFLALACTACHYTSRTTGSDSDLGTIAALAGVDMPPTIYELAWLEGAWRGTGLGGVVEEVWSRPEDGAMVGHFRFTKDGNVAFYELTTLGPIDDSGRLGMKVKHFHPDLRGWEDKDRWVTFPLRAIEGDTARFDGLTIRRISDDEMEITVRLRGGDGKVSDEVLAYRRVR